MRLESLLVPPPSLGLTTGATPSGSMALLARAQAGDEQALDELLRSYLPRLKKWVSGRLPDHCRGLNDTDDLVQDTLISVLRLIPKFEIRHDAGFQAYLRQAVWNRLRAEIRSLGAKPLTVELEDGLTSPESSPIDRAIGQEALARYEAALLNLDEDQRSAVIGRLEFGYSYPELALMLGRRTPDAARKLVERALPLLADWMRHGP